MSDDKGHDSNRSEKPQPESFVGGPLFLADARYLAQELENLGIKSKLSRDLFLGSRREQNHFLTVAREDLETAVSIREKLLPEDDEPESESGGSETETGTGKRRYRKSSLVLGIVGSVTGLRVASMIHKSPWLALLAAATLGVSAFAAAELFHGE